jgi:hypothetical protein
MAWKPSPSSGLPGKPGTPELSERQGQAWSFIAINLDLNARPITSYGARVIVFARTYRRCRPLHLRPTHDNSTNPAHYQQQIAASPPAP